MSQYMCQKEELQIATGFLIQLERLRVGLTVKELSDCIGISVPLLDCFERGIFFVKPDALLLIGKALNSPALCHLAAARQKSSSKQGTQKA